MACSSTGTVNAVHPCARVVKPELDLIVHKEITDAIGRNYRTLPTFEKGLHEYRYKKHYSLATNEYLKCRWEDYVRNFDKRVFAPFQFLDIRDYHFTNCRNILKPSMSVHTKTDFRNKLKPGPGVDAIYGTQLPIPQEVLMTRGEAKKKKPKKEDKKGSFQKENARHEKKKK